MFVLHIENLSVSFTQYENGMRQKTWNAINDLSVDVRSREITAVVGASGSGKSILARAVMGLLPYNARMEGEILYKGERLTQEYVKKLRGKEIVFVPQTMSHLDPMMKVGKQVLRGRKDKERKEKLCDIFQRYHLKQETKDMYPFQLSGGMGRRILISTALIEEAELVIADEPTPGLDLELAKLVMGHFRELADLGAAVLVITHDLELALRTADRIVVFYDGTTVDEMTPEVFLEGSSFGHPYTEALWRAMPEHGFAHISEQEMKGWD